MQGTKRRVVYVLLFEAIAIAFSSTVLTATTDRPVTAAGATAVGSSLIAMVWNWAYNSMFERWERRQQQKGRSLLRRVVHATGFEIGLVVLLVPLFAVLLRMSLWQALGYNVGLVAFFLGYGVVFNLVFDRIFGLPASALPEHQGSPSQ